MSRARAQLNTKYILHADLIAAPQTRVFVQVSFRVKIFLNCQRNKILIFRNSERLFFGVILFCKTILLGEAIFLSSSLNFAKICEKQCSLVFREQKNVY